MIKSKHLAYIFLLILLTFGCSFVGWIGVPIPHGLSANISEYLLEHYSVPIYAEKMELALSPHLRVRLENVKFGIPVNQGGEGNFTKAENQTLNEERLYLSFAKLNAELDLPKALMGRWKLRAISIENTLLQIPQLQESLAAAMQIIRPANDIGRHISFHTATIELKNVELNFSEPDLLNGKLVIDQMRLDLQGLEASHMGARWFSYAQPQGAPPTIEASGLIHAPRGNDQHWQLNQIAGDLKGSLGDYPWTIRTTIDEGTLIGGVRLGFKLSNLRGYIRRNDAPDEHQATVSAAQLHWGLADGRAQFVNGIWTYTDHHATAWKFDAAVDMATRTFVVRAKEMDGSEAESTTLANWQLPCHMPRNGGWIWRKGWFEYQTGSAKPTKSQWLFCN